MSDPRSNNFWLFLELLAKRKKMIFSIVIVVTLAAIVVSLVLPKWYTATALLLPPKNISVPLEQMSDWSEAFSVTSGLNLPVRATPSDIYLRMLESRTVASRIIDQFNLSERYDAGNYEETVLALRDHADLSVSEEGLLVVSVEDKDPQVAADIANAFVVELEKVIGEIVSDRLNRTKEFLADRLRQVKAELDSSRAALEAFQMKHRAVDFDEQTRLAIEQATALKVTLAEIELELKVAEMNLGDDNADLIELQRRRQVVQNQLRTLETENVDSSFFSLPVSSIPALKGQYEILYSRVRVAEALYGVLLEQTEQAKIKEFENLPTVSVLDKATPPTLRSRPQRSIIVGVSFGLAVIVALLLAATAEYLVRLKDTSPEDYGRLMMFVESFFGWLPGVKKTKRSNVSPPGRKEEETNVNIDHR